MAKGWTIGQGVQREASVPCFNESCRSCDVRSGCCRIQCGVCADRVLSLSKKEEV